jgi:beta-lactamase superfamily II metal-dependent hydrolase
MRESGWIEGSPIDFLVATHPDKDHYGGTWKILQEHQVKAFVSSGIYSENKTYQTALNAVNLEPSLINLTPVTQTGLNPSEPGQKSTDSWGRNIEVTLLSADQGASSDNNSSVVLMIEYLGTRILLTGDAEEPLDRALLELEATQPGILGANVLKAGHHAGVGTNSSELLQKVFNSNITRRYAIVSAGLRDGLPNEETLQRLETAVGEKQVYRTDRGDLLAGKDRSNSAGDDHILLRVTQDGDLTLCYAYSDLL